MLSQNINSYPPTGHYSVGLLTINDKIEGLKQVSVNSGLFL